MHVELLRTVRGQRRRDVVKYYFNISQIECTLDELLEIVLVETVLNSFILGVTPDTFIGFELWSNIIVDAPPIFLPFCRRSELSTKRSLVRELNRIHMSNKIFLNLDEAFELCITTVNQ